MSNTGSVPIPLTSAQVSAAMAAINAALNDTDVPVAFENSLNELSNVLQGIQDALIEKTERDLVDALAANNTELQALNDKINAMSASLDKVAATINKVSNTVGIVASAIGALV